MFLNTGDEYTGKGFKKLAKLKDAFSGAYQIQVAMKISNLTKAHAQGELSPKAYESDLLGLFEKFAISGNPLTACFQFMFMVCGLSEEYGQLIVDFRNGHRKFLKEDLASVTAWCKNFDKKVTRTASPEWNPSIIIARPPLPPPLPPVQILEPLALATTISPGNI